MEKQEKKFDKVFQGFQIICTQTFLVIVSAAAILVDNYTWLYRIIASAVFIALFAAISYYLHRRHKVLHILYYDLAALLLAFLVILYCLK